MTVQPNLAPVGDGATGRTFVRVGDPAQTLWLSAASDCPAWTQTTGKTGAVNLGSGALVELDSAEVVEFRDYKAVPVA